MDDEVPLATLLHDDGRERVATRDLLEEVHRVALGAEHLVAAHRLTPLAAYNVAYAGLCLLLRRIRLDDV